MAVKRIVTNIATDRIEAAKSFYGSILGMSVVMDLGWIMTFAADAQTTPQISIAAEGGAGTPVPDISIEVDNIGEVHQLAVAAGFKIEYGPTTESLGRQAILRVGSMRTVGQHPDAYRSGHRRLTRDIIQLPPRPPLGVINSRGGKQTRLFRWRVGAPYRARQPPRGSAMLTDRYDLPLSTTSATARDAYVRGTDAKLTMYPGAIEAFDLAIAADSHFALPHAARAHALLERGDAAAAREAMAAANALAPGLPAREASHVAYFGHLIAGDAEAALTALPAHLDAWPRDVLVLGTTAFTNGLIGSSGRAGQKRRLLALLDQLAPQYGEDDWWFAAHHGMALSENGQHDAARPKIEKSLAQNPKNPWAAHATAHLAYETSDPDAARSFLAAWLNFYPRNGALYSHLSWHLAIGHLEAGDAAAAAKLFRDAFAPEVHTGPPRGKLNDAVSFLWRWELAGHQRDAAAWRTMHDFADRAFPRAGAAFSDMHIALAQAVAGDAAAMALRAQADRGARACRPLSVRRVRSGGGPGLRRVRAGRFRCGNRRAGTDRR